MTELEELRLAYAECSRQRNDLLIAHKKAALAPAIDAALKLIRSSSAVIGNLPESPGYNGSVLLIDDDEADRISSDLEKAAEMLKEYSAKPPEPDCRTCRSVVQRNGTGCGSVILCTRGDRYEAMRPIHLWTTI